MELFIPLKCNTKCFTTVKNNLHEALKRCSKDTLKIGWLGCLRPPASKDLNISRLKMTRATDWIISALFSLDKKVITRCCWPQTLSSSPDAKAMVSVALKIPWTDYSPDGWKYAPCKQPSSPAWRCDHIGSIVAPGPRQDTQVLGLERV